MSLGKLKSSKDKNTISHADPSREIKRLHKVIKKQGNEIAKDISKIEVFTHQLRSEIVCSNRAFDKIAKRLYRIEQSMLPDDILPNFQEYETFNDHKENVHVNLAGEASKYSLSHRRDTGIDRADLLIMCNKIKEDIKKSFQDTIQTNKFNSTFVRSESLPDTKSDRKSSVQRSIEKYRTAYCSVKQIDSPVKRIKYDNTVAIPTPVVFNSTTTRSVGKTLDPKASFNNTSHTTDIIITKLKTPDENEKVHHTKLASSSFTTMKSKDKNNKAHQKKVKSKKALSKLNKIYKDLQSMEKEFRYPLQEL
jgi:hypothetical protein